MIELYRTVEAKKQYIRRMPDLEFSDAAAKNVPLVAVNSAKTYQTHMGFGGAFTESAAYVLAQAGDKIRDEVCRAYFSKDGLRYNLGRVSVHSNDFSLENYTYIRDHDDSLSSYDVSREEKWVFPLIERARGMAERELAFMVASWSAPYWMKTNGDMNYGGRLKKEYRDIWAEYCCKFVCELKKRGLNVKMMSVQNEPEAVQTWESCLVSAEEEAEYVKYHLYPALKKYGLDTEIYIWDHNRDRVARRAAVTLADKEVRDIVKGVAYHWYVSEESKNLSAVHEMFPEKHLLMTECCVELTAEGESSSAYVQHAERYGRNIINDFNNFSEGWLDWNLALDMKGGPNHVANYCEAPVMVDTEKKTYTVNPSFDYIGHFSRFIEPGAKRLTCVNDVNSGLYSLAYKNPDGRIVVVIQNEGWVTETTVCVDGKYVNVNLPGHSIVTLIIK